MCPSRDRDMLHVLVQSLEQLDVKTLNKTYGTPKRAFCEGPGWELSCLSAGGGPCLRVASQKSPEPSQEARNGSAACWIACHRLSATAGRRDGSLLCSRVMSSREGAPEQAIPGKQLLGSRLCTTPTSPPSLGAFAGCWTNGAC